IAILFLVGVAIALWIRFFPRSRVGQAMTVSRDESTFTAVQDGLDDLVGAQGEAKSDLRPAGFALISGRRVDVVTQGGMIDKGATITVVEVEGNRVVVKRTET
ncbi:MAG: NfeD family protein, partial [Kiritimatiellia bacterium]|nr:NfeD family protein [Kiritimatiellia bacterium]